MTREADAANNENKPPQRGWLASLMGVGDGPHFF
jgi:hypothetical protein